MYFCSELNNVLTFFPEGIRSCCIIGRIGPVYLSDYNDKIEIDWELFKRRKKEAYDNILQNKLENSTCKDCFYLKEKTEEDLFNEQFSLIYLNNWTQCNCGCFYCDRMGYTKGEITKKKEDSRYYNALPVIKGLYKNNLLDKDNLRVVFHGGDLSVLKEFEPLLKEFIKNGVNKIDFASNNIIFQPLIKDLLARNKASLNMSLDCGTRETYKKIKRVDKFNDVISNLKKYVTVSKSDNPEINVKYIILENVNDNEEEIKKFIDLMVKIGIKRVSLHLEHKYATDIFKKDIPLPGNYKKLITLFFSLCEMHKLYFDKPDEIMNHIISGN